MQIDFHHAVTYVTARIAGFGHPEADVIAYAAQYVDDCTSSGTVCFKTGERYSRISSSHKCLDLHNLSDGEDHIVWVPFHFLPGNGGFPAGVASEQTFAQRLICLPGDKSAIAQELVERALHRKQSPTALHSLGITMHVYADTWAHQGFAGMIDDENLVTDMKAAEGFDFNDDEKEWWERWYEHAARLFSREIAHLGHACADVLPDMPFLRWQYVNGSGKLVQRDNTEIFCAAASAMCKAMQRYRSGDASADVTGIPDGDLRKIRELFAGVVDHDGRVRHGRWIEAIRRGEFSFGAADAAYDRDGVKTWKVAALGTADDREAYEYRPEFVRSNWKLFHDALQEHRLVVLHEILPRYGICAD